MNNGPRFCIVPAAALDDGRLSDSDLKTLLVLGRYADKHGWCHPYQRDLCAAMGVKSRQAVSHRLRRLVEFGWVIAYRGLSKKGAQIANTYRVRFDLDKPPANPVCAGRDDPGEKPAAPAPEGVMAGGTGAGGEKQKLPAPASSIAVNGSEPLQNQGEDPRNTPPQAPFAPPQEQGFAPPQEQGFAPPQEQGFAPYKDNPSNDPSNDPPNGARKGALALGADRPPADEDLVRWAFDGFAGLARALKLPVPQRLDPARAALIRARLREHGPGGWTRALEKIRHSPICTGQTEIGWRIDLDALIDPRKFRKLIEGSYDDKRPRHGKRDERRNAILEGAQEFISGADGADPGD